MNTYNKIMRPYRKNKEIIKNEIKKYAFEKNKVEYIRRLKEEQRFVVNKFLEGKESWNRWSENVDRYDVDFRNIDFSKLIKNGGNIDFSGYIFPKGTTSFSGVKFNSGGRVSFDGAIFESNIVEFGSEGNQNTTFFDGKQDISFKNAKFYSEKVLFENILIKDNFFGELSFEGTEFFNENKNETGNLKFLDFNISNFNFIFEKIIFRNYGFSFDNIVSDGNHFIINAIISDEPLYLKIQNSFFGLNRKKVKKFGSIEITNMELNTLELCDCEINVSKIDLTGLREVGKVYFLDNDSNVFPVFTDRKKDNKFNLHSIEVSENKFSSDVEINALNIKTSLSFTKNKIDGSFYSSDLIVKDGCYDFSNNKLVNFSICRLNKNGSWPLNYKINYFDSSGTECSGYYEIIETEFYCVPKLQKTDIKNRFSFANSKVLFDKIKYDKTEPEELESSREAALRMEELFNSIGDFRSSMQYHKHEVSEIRPKIEDTGSVEKLFCYFYNGLSKCGTSVFLPMSWIFFIPFIPSSIIFLMQFLYNVKIGFWDSYLMFLKNNILIIPVVGKHYKIDDGLRDNIDNVLFSGFYDVVFILQIISSVLLLYLSIKAAKNLFKIK